VLDLPADKLQIALNLLETMNQSFSILSLVKTKSWLFGLAAGVSGAVTLALFITAWEWLENPGSIFHGPEARVQTGGLSGIQR